MIAKEKAKDLVDKYYWVFGDGYLGEQHIQCALLAVDEMLELIKKTEYGIKYIQLRDYLFEVKSEIENL